MSKKYYSFVITHKMPNSTNLQVKKRQCSIGQTTGQNNLCKLGDQKYSDTKNCAENYVWQETT